MSAERSCDNYNQLIEYNRGEYIICLCEQCQRHFAVGPGNLISLQLKRNTEMIISVHGGYVPLIGRTDASVTSVCPYCRTYDTWPIY